MVAPSCCHLPLSHPPIHSPPPPASYLLTRKDVFFTKSEFCQIISAMLRGKDARVKVDLPPPALWKVGHSAYGRKWVCGCGCCVGLCIFPIEAEVEDSYSTYYIRVNSVMCTCLSTSTAVSVCLEVLLSSLLHVCTPDWGHCSHVTLLVCAPLCTCDGPHLNLAVACSFIVHTSVQLQLNEYDHQW